MITSTGYSIPIEKKTRFLQLAVYILSFLFFLNCFTPLRLHYDMLRYFAIKDCIESKCPPEADPNDYLPYGYTVLLLLLSKLGLLKSFCIVFVNCLYLLGGLYFVRKTFPSTRSPYFIFFLVLLNWTIIKFVTHPLSEMQYLFFSIAAVFTFYKFTLSKNIRDLLLAFLLAGLAFLTRSVGITLIGAFLVSLIWEFRKQLLEIIKSKKILIVTILICITIVLYFSKQLGLNHYSGVFSKQFSEGVRFSVVIGWHFSEWGEIFLNTSRVKVISYLPSGFGDLIFTIMGILGFAGFIFICFIKRNRIPVVVKSYLFFYIILMFNWPFQDPRFWVPVVPLMAAVFSLYSLSKSMIIRVALICWLIIYSTLGLVSVGYMTYTSFNKEELSKTQAKGVYRNEYETHFFGKPLSDTATRTDSYLVDFLNRYDNRSEVKNQK